MALSLLDYSIREISQEEVFYYLMFYSPSNSEVVENIPENPLIGYRLLGPLIDCRLRITPVEKPSEYLSQIGRGELVERITTKLSKNNHFLLTKGNILGW